MRRLLTTGNPKTEKGAKYGYFSAVLHLAPSDSSGYGNVCPMAKVAACEAGCLNTAGRAAMAVGGKTFESEGGTVLPENVIHHARLERTRLWFQEREGFCAKLEKEVRAHIRKSKKKDLIPAIRLNGTSDIRWELIRRFGPNGDQTIMAVFPDIQFYDYTKIGNRRKLPANYHLTFSYSEANAAYQPAFDTAVQAGRNVAVVFRTPEFPGEFLGMQVVNGDEHDLRFLDKPGCIVGLKAKGRAKVDASGFVVDSVTTEVDTPYLVGV